jgi:hypothetical protein
MRPIWKILIAAAAGIAFVVALLAIPHYRAKAAVRNYREQLKRQGEKMSIAELTPSLTAEEASNGRELAAAAGLVNYFPDSPPTMRWLAPGQVLLDWRETNSATEITTNCWPVFAEVIKEHQEFMGRMAAALRGPGLGFSVDYQQGFNAPLLYLMPFKKGSVWFWGATILALHEGDTTNAWNHLKSLTDLVRMNHGEPLMISQLVRMAVAHMAVSATWEALQYPGWSDAQLAPLQTNWDSFNLVDQLEPALSMERELQRMTLTEMRKSFGDYEGMGGGWHIDNGGYDSISQVLINPKEGIPAYLGRYPRYWMWKWWGSYDEELYAMQIMQAALNVMRNARTNEAFIPMLNNYNETLTNVLQRSHPGWERRFVFANGLTETTARFMLKAANAETERRMAVTAIALERYRLRHKEYPARLEELTPDYLARTPIDFMDGKPLRYRRKDDGTFWLYSVGEDGKDDGGDGSPPPSYTAQNKAWYRMRDAVWPAPATPDEVKKYEAEMFQKLMNKPPGRLVPQMTIPKPAGTSSKTN